MIGDRLAEIEARVAAACVRAGRKRNEVRLLAVSKGHSVAAVLEAYEAGLRDFGESYVQDWQKKAEDPALLRLHDLRWHFIGHLQRNKIRMLLGRVETVQTVDRIKLARELSQRAEAQGRVQRVMLQVNLEEESSKSGFSGSEAAAALEQCLALPGLSPIGLMAIPPRRPDAESSRSDHRALAQLRNRLEVKLSCHLPELSMGMSQDFEVAIEEGSTEVRVGTALFGPRAARG